MWILLKVILEDEGLWCHSFLPVVVLRVLTLGAVIVLCQSQGSLSVVVFVIALGDDALGCLPKIYSYEYSKILSGGGNATLTRPIQICWWKNRILRLLIPQTNIDPKTIGPKRNHVFQRITSSLSEVWGWGSLRFTRSRRPAAWRKPNILSRNHF